jgi:hypothetical protein
VCLAALAGCCAFTLYARVYTQFERVRILVVRTEQRTPGGTMSLPLPNVSALVGTVASIVMNVESGDRADRLVSVSVNGREVGRRLLSPGQPTRVDLNLPAGFEQADGNAIEISSDGGPVSVHLLEVGNAHGFSHGLFSLVIVPAALRQYASVPAWVALGAFSVFFLTSMSFFRRIRTRPLRAAHRILAGLVLFFLFAAAILPWVSDYKVLLSLQAFWICVGVLYLPVASRAYRALQHRAAVVASSGGWQAVAPRAAQAARVVVAHRTKLLYVMAVAVFVVSLMGFYDERTGFTNLIRFGAEFEPRAVPALRAVPHEHDGPWGYDGQFYAQLALDPLTLDPAIERALDNFPYRARRILFSWTAFAFGLGQPGWVLQAYALQNVLSWFILAVLLLRWFPPIDAKHFFGWFAVLFSHGLISSVGAALLEGPSLLLLVIAMIAIDRNRRWIAACLIGVSVLGRETNVLSGSALAERLPRAWRPARVLAGHMLAVGLPMVLWVLYLRASHPDVPFDVEGGRNFALPLSGYFGDWVDTVTQLRAQGWESFARFDLLALTSVATQLIFFAVRRQWSSPWFRVALAYVTLMLFLGPAVWEGTPGAFTRVLLPMTCAYNVLLPRGRAYWPLAVLGNLSVIHGLQVLRVPLIWPYL